MYAGQKRLCVVLLFCLFVLSPISFYSQSVPEPNVAPVSEEAVTVVSRLNGVFVYIGGDSKIFYKKSSISSDVLPAHVDASPKGSSVKKKPDNIAEQISAKKLASKQKVPAPNKVRLFINSSQFPLGGYSGNSVMEGSACTVREVQSKALFLPANMYSQSFYAFTLRIGDKVVSFSSLYNSCDNFIRPPPSFYSGRV